MQPQKQYTLSGYFNIGLPLLLWIFVVVMFVNLSIEGQWLLWELVLAFISVCALIIGLYVHRNNQFKRRATVIDQIAQQNNWSVFPPVKDTGATPHFSLSSIAKLSEAGINLRNCIYAQEWAYCDYTYEVYRETKYGSYKESEYFYALMGTVLPRKLPNIIFDSIKSRKRQFRAVYDESQLHTLEGNFDQHFATYFPKTYTIDSLSFISPDVMEALIEADEYDIEIIDNNLFIFGPISDPRVQIPEMAAKLQRIKQELLDNILTYRDERLPYEKGRQEVAVEGARLQKAKEKWWLTVLLVVGYLIFRFILESS